MMSNIHNLPIFYILVHTHKHHKILPGHDVPQNRDPGTHQRSFPVTVGINFTFDSLNITGRRDFITRTGDSAPTRHRDVLLHAAVGRPGVTRRERMHGLVINLTTPVGEMALHSGGRMEVEVDVEVGAEVEGGERG